MSYERPGRRTLLVCLVAALLLPAAAQAQLITAPGAGVSPAVRVIDTNGTERTFFAYHPAFTGGVRLALGDVTGDGVLDIVTGAGPGGGPHVRIWDGVTLAEVGGFFAYHPAFAGGVFVAAGDVDGDGRADIITGAGAGGGPHVRIWSGADFHEIGGFFAYHPAFPGGVTVAAGDVDGDGRADVITGAGPGGGPHVRVWSGVTFNEIGGFFAYHPAFPGGVSVAAGDVDNDGRADIITGAGPGGGPHVRVWNATNFSEIGGFFAYDPAFPGGVQVGAIDLTGDGRVEIITGLGPGGLPISSIFNGADLSLMGSYFAFDPSLRVGVFVGSVGKNSALRFTSASATTFARNSAGTFTVTTAGGASAPTLTVTGSLPSGVTFTDNGDRTATLAGTPTATGVFPLTFTANNGSGTPVVQSFTLTVSEAPAITSANNATFNIGSVGATFTITTTGSPTPLIALSGALPSGISFTDNTDGTATLAGTAAPGTAGTYPLVISAGNGVGSPATQNFTLTITQGTAITSASATTFTAGIAGSFTVTTASSPVAGTINVTGALPGGVSFTNNGNGTATIAGPPGASTGGSYPLTITASNGVGAAATQSFTLTVNQAPAITSAASTTFMVGAAGTFTITTTGFPMAAITSAGALPDGVTFTDNGNGTASIAGTPGAGTGGSYPLTVTAASGVGSNALQSFTLTVNQTPAITSANAVTFTTGQSGTFTVTATGVPTPALSSSGAMPAGVNFLDIGNGTATLTGTPGAGAGGTYSLTFTAANGVVPNAVQAFTLSVQQAPAITSANNATFTVGQAGSFTITTTGFPAASIGSSGALPGGVTFTNNGDGTATIAGTPDAATGGTYPVTITTTNAAGAATPQSFTLTVNQPPAITSASSTTFTVGQAGSFTVTTSGVPAVTTITRGGAALPSGVSYTDNGDGTATLSGTPGAGTGGTYGLTFTAINGVGSPALQSFTLTVNQAPAITSANNATFTVGQAGSFTVTMTGFPTASIARGGAALPGGVTFVDNSNGTGTLSGTPAGGTAGPYALTFTATNVVGSSPVQNFTLTVACPVITVTPSAGALAEGTFGQAYSQAFGAAGSTGITFAVTAGALPPNLTLASNGQLTGTATNTGTFTFTVTATDAFACTGSSAYSILVRPDAVNEAFSGGVGNTQYVVAPSPTSSTPAVLAVGTVLSNDQGPGALSAAAGTFATANAGSVSIGANGAFVYSPLAGFTGTSDTFSYTLVDGNGVTDTATVTINLSGMVWYVNPLAGAGDGRSHLPFNTMAGAESASTAGQVIYVHGGGAAGGITLKPSQTLWGSGQTFTLSGLTIAATGNPQVNGTITLANGTLVNSLNVNGGAASAIVGTSLSGTETINNFSINGGSVGLNLTTMAGTVTVTNASFGGVSGAEVSINGGAGTVDVGATITNTVGRSVEIQNRTGGTVTFSNPITDNAGGILMNANTGSTIAFTGGMTLNTGANPGFTATNGGTVTATGTNIISTTTGIALNVANTNIGAAGLTFRSIASDGAVNGILLSNTGAAGGLTVTGDGLNTSVGGNGSGGTIANSAGADGAVAGSAIYLSQTRDVVLRRMTISGNNQNFGIRGVNVTNFTMEYSTVTGSNGTSAALDEGAVNFDNLLGTAAITGSVIEGGFEDNLNVVNTGGTLNRLVVSGSTFGFNNSANGNNNILIESQNPGTVLNFTIQSSTIKGARADWINASNNSSSSMDAVLTGNTFDNLGLNAHPGAAAGGNRVVLGSTGTMTFDVQGNTLRGSKGEAIRIRGTGVAGGATGTATGHVRSNLVGVQATANSGSSEGSGIFVFGDGGSDMTVAVTGNTVHQYNNHGILLQFGDELNDGSVFNVTVTGNTVSTPGNVNTDFNAIHLNNGTVAATDNFTSCVNIGGAGVGNNVAGGGSGVIPPNNADIRLRQRQSTTVLLPGYAGANNDDAAVVSYLAGRNTLSTAAASNTVPTGGGFVGVAGCIVP